MELDEQLCYGLVRTAERMAAQTLQIVFVDVLAIHRKFERLKFRL